MFISYKMKRKKSDVEEEEENDNDNDWSRGNDVSDDDEFKPATKKTKKTTGKK